MKIDDINMRHYRKEYPNEIAAKYSDPALEALAISALAREHAGDLAPAFLTGATVTQFVRGDRAAEVEVCFHDGEDADVFVDFTSEQDSVRNDCSSGRESEPGMDARGTESELPRGERR